MDGRVTGDYPDISEWPDVPTHIAAESAVLGHILLDNKVYDKVRGKLGPEDFFLDAHKTIFLRMTEMREAEKPVDLVTLCDWMAGKLTGETRELDEIGGRAVLFGMTEDILRTCPNVDEYVLILQEKTKLRRILGACERASAKCRAQGETAAEIVGQLGTALKGLGKRAK